MPEVAAPRRSTRNLNKRKAEEVKPAVSAAGGEPAPKQAKTTPAAAKAQAGGWLESIKSLWSTATGSFGLSFSKKGPATATKAKAPRAARKAGSK